MNLEDYKTKLPYPVRVERPSIARNASALEAEEYIYKLKVYETKKLAYDLQKKAYQEVEARLAELFKNDLFKELGITNHPKKDALYRFAWEYGHSGGLREVVGHAENLVELLK